MSDIETLLKEAKKLNDDKNFKGAQECCDAILREDQDNYLALILLGKSLQDSHETPDAYEELIKSKPSELLSWQSLANYYEQKKDGSLKVKLFPIYDEMLKLQVDEEMVIEILTKLGKVGCLLKSSESITYIIKFISEHQENLKDVAEKQLIELLKSDVPCKYDDISAVINILRDINAANPSDTVQILICKVILQKGNFKSAFKEITALEFFSKNVAVKQFLCKYLCVYFINNTSFNGLDMDEYLDTISIEMECSKYVGFLRSMNCFYRAYLVEAYLQCIPLVNYEGTDKIDVLYLIKCTIGLKKWSVTQRVAKYFLTKVKDSSLKITLQKILFHSYVKQHKWCEAITTSKKISTDLLNTDELAALVKCYKKINESAEHILDSFDGDQYTQIQALALIKEEKYEEVLNVLQNSKKDSLRYFYLGKAYWYLKEYKKCYKNLRKSAEVNYDHPDTFYALGLFYHQYKDDLQKAKIYYEKAYCLCNFDGLYVKNLSEVYMKLDLESHAFILLEKTYKIIPTKEVWLNSRLGLHYLKRSDWENAIKKFLDVLDVTPNDPLILERLADAYYGRGSYVFAMRGYYKVMALDLDNVRSSQTYYPYYNFGYAYFKYHLALRKMSHNKMVFKMTHAFMKKNPKRWQAWNLLIRLELLLNKLIKANKDREN